MARVTDTLAAFVPLKFKSPVMSGSTVSSLICCGEAKIVASKAMSSVPAAPLALVSAARNDPVPESAVFATVKVAGARRSSSSLT